MDITEPCGSRRFLWTEHPRLKSWVESDSGSMMRRRDTRPPTGRLKLRSVDRKWVGRPRQWNNGWTRGSDHHLERRRNFRSGSGWPTGFRPRHVTVRVTVSSTTEGGEEVINEFRKTFFVSEDPDLLEAFPIYLGASGESSPNLQIWMKTGKTN